MVASPVEGAAEAATTTQLHTAPATPARLVRRRAARKTDETSLLADESGAQQEEVELPVRTKLAQAASEPEVWKAKADDVPLWVAPSSVGRS